MNSFTVECVGTGYCRILNPEIIFNLNFDFQFCRELAQDSALKDTLISVDTFHSTVARWAVDAGAHIINDVSGGTLDPDMHAEVLP